MPLVPPFFEIADEVVKADVVIVDAEHKVVHRDDVDEDESNGTGIRLTWDEFAAQVRDVDPGTKTGEQAHVHTFRVSRDGLR